MLRPIWLVAILPALFFAACLAEPKTGCRTTDDCAPGRLCVAGTCQRGARDAGLDASFDEQSSGDVATDLSERPIPDLAGYLDDAPDLVLPLVDVAPDASAAIDAPENMAGPDASFDKQSTTDVPSPDLAGGTDGLPDLASLAVDAAPESPIFPMIDAPSASARSDTGSDRQPSVGVAIDLQKGLSPDLEGDRDVAPDLAPPLIAATPDAPVVPIVDAPASNPPTASIDASDAEWDGAGDLAPGPVSWEDFLAQSPREPWTGGRFIVDGDLAFDETGLQRYYDAWFAAVGISHENLAPMGATALWPFPDSFSLSYCISTSFGDNFAAIEAAMQVATASWSDRAGVWYAYLPEEDPGCNADNTNVTFDVRPVSGAGYAAVSFFPDSPRSARSLLVDASAFAVGVGAPGLEAVLRHQLGHTLGFQHEHLWLDPACTSEDSRLAVRIANYDIDSVMHLPVCRPSELGGTIQTEGDFAGAITIYGLSPALIVVFGI